MLDRYNFTELEVMPAYHNVVARKYPTKLGMWPLLMGYNEVIHRFRGVVVIVIYSKESGETCWTRPGGELPQFIPGVKKIDLECLEEARTNVSKYFGLKRKDCVVILLQKSDLERELFKMLKQHESIVLHSPMKIFLSHKSADKPTVREFKKTLVTIGHDPWLDEDAMHAGLELERALKKGFNDSCAAVFFVTPNYIDENYLATEINYAIQEKRNKGKSFSIITLVFHEGGKKASVPELLTPYVWKEPVNNLEALHEILRSLPIKFGPREWKE